MHMLLPEKNKKWSCDGERGGGESKFEQKMCFSVDQNKIKRDKIENEKEMKAFFFKSRSGGAFFSIHCFKNRLKFTVSKIKRCQSA